MSRKQTATVGLTAMLVILVLAVAALAMAMPMPAAGAGAVEPVIRVRDTGEAFIVRWTVPEGVAPQEQTIDAWIDDGYRRVSSTSVSVEDDARQAGIRMDRTDEAGTAYGFTVSMLSDGERIASKPKYLFPHGRMDKQPPSGLEALWHDDGYTCGGFPAATTTTSGNGPSVASRNRGPLGRPANWDGATGRWYLTTSTPTKVTSAELRRARPTGTAR